MKARKLICLLLSLVLVLALGIPAAAADETAGEAPAEEEIPDYIVKMMAASEAYAPDTKVLTVNGQDIPWALYYNLLTQELQTYIYYMGGLPTDFSELITDDVTVEQYLKESALSYSEYYATVYAKAAENGIELTAEDEAELDEAWAALVEQYGGEETIEELLKESCMTKDTYYYLLRSNTLMAKLMDKLYGTNGEKLTDEEVLAWANENGFVRTKHILYKYTGGEAAEDATEEKKTAAAEKDKEQVRKTAEKTLKKLEKLSGDKLLEEFDKLMTEESQDPGSMAYPDGYVFTSGKMVKPFEDAAFALEDNTISGVVESDYGCHIILRLPLEAESVTMEQDSNTGAYLTLRENAAATMFNNDFVDWIKDAKVEWEPGFEALELNKLFNVDPNAPVTEDAAEGETAVETEKSGMSKDTKTLIIVLAAIAAVVIALLILLRKKQNKVEELTEKLAAAEKEAVETVEETEEVVEEAVETAEETAEEAVETVEEAVEAAEETAETENTEN